MTGVRDWDAPAPVTEWTARDVDEARCAEVLAGMEPIEEMLRASGQYGPRRPVADDAPASDRLMAFLGRDPGWRP
ncbi:hypothetical protein QE364_001574 [Nocardioides zeae]|uniref:Uncharacterized protein n=1 Tax=Nocardioides zeae TaxID=1457234 RepID=A0ACC6IGT9_9ACTN|nr:hypothetical protein [Nocardioides zeae]MDR6172864.1 hypothetical protein [Nocardioides zeae]MDR6209874.1 hypothetical protein [Nocardioides zeae]